MVDKKEKISININRVLTTLATVAILGFIGTIYDFQNVKATVKKQQSRLDVIGIIVCKYAIKDKLENAAKICQDVVKGD